MMDIACDMETICPDAVMLNYTNPMAMLCNYLQHHTKITVTGLCHSVQGTAEMLAKWIDAPMADVTFRCAGINHMAWYLEYSVNGEDAIPLIRKKILEDESIYNEEIVRNEMFLNLDYYVTESSGHNSEYNWWFRKRPDLIGKYCLKGTGWNPGEYAYIVKETVKAYANWEQLVEEWFASEDAKILDRGHEYAAYIINALLGGDPFEFNGNVLNRGLVTNLPYEACVEVPVWVDRKGFSPVFVGDLPDQCAMLTNLTAMTENLAVRGSFEGNARLIFQAIAHDPLTSAVLSLSEIRDMVNVMFEKNKNFLPQFEIHKV
jgi:alpha-galactosidase